MKLVESLPQWTEWVRQELLSRSSLPLISGNEIDMRSQAFDIYEKPLDDIRDPLETFLAQHYRDPAARLVVLSFFWQLLTLVWIQGS